MDEPLTRNRRGVYWIVGIGAAITAAHVATTLPWVYPGDDLRQVLSWTLAWPAYWLMQGFLALFG